MAEGAKTGAHLLRHAVTPEIAAAAARELGHDQLEAGKAIIELRQPRLRELFQRVYNVQTASGNNEWMKSKLLQAVGLHSRWRPEQQQQQEQQQAGPAVAAGQRARRQPAALRDEQPSSSDSEAEGGAQLQSSRKTKAPASSRAGGAVSKRARVEEFGTAAAPTPPPVVLLVMSPSEAAQWSGTLQPPTGASAGASPAPQALPSNGWHLMPSLQHAYAQAQVQQHGMQQAQRVVQTHAAQLAGIQGAQLDVQRLPGMQGLQQHAQQLASMQGLQQHAQQLASMQGLQQHVQQLTGRQGLQQQYTQQLQSMHLMQQQHMQPLHGSQGLQQQHAQQLAGMQAVQLQHAQQLASAASPSLLGGSLFLGQQEAGVQGQSATLAALQAAGLLAQCGLPHLPAAGSSQISSEFSLPWGVPPLFGAASSALAAAAHSVPHPQPGPPNAAAQPAPVQPSASTGSGASILHLQAPHTHAGPVEPSPFAAAAAIPLPAAAQPEHGAGATAAAHVFREWTQEGAWHGHAAPHSVLASLLSGDLSALGMRGQDELRALSSMLPAPSADLHRLFSAWADELVSLSFSNRDLPPA